MLNPEHAKTFCRGVLCALLSKLLLFPSNRSFLSYKNSHFQNKAKCKTFLVYLNFICMRISLKKFIEKSFKFIMPMVFLLVATLLKHFKRGRRVCMYTTQVNSAFRARWLASSVISQVLYLAFKWRHKNPYSKIARTFKVLSPSGKISLKNTLPRKFSSWYRFPFWKYSSF